MHTFTAGGKTVTVFPAAAPDATVVYLNTFGEEGQKVFDALPVDPPLTLVAVSGLDWDRDMAPWGSPAVFKNAAPFSGGADDYLRLLTEEILPTAERQLAGTPRWRGIAGYSLAGLFAVYALCNTDAFSRAASVSGSLWFPGFKEYVLSHPPHPPAGLRLFLPGRPGEQNAQPGAPDGAGEHRGHLCVLPGAGHPRRGSGGSQTDKSCLYSSIGHGFLLRSGAIISVTGKRG